MWRRWWLGMLAGLVMSHAALAVEGGVAELPLAGGLLVRADVSPAEPASLGSYSLRLYQIEAAAGQPQDDVLMRDFLSGVVHARDGSLVKLVFCPAGVHQGVNVITQSAGSGGYLARARFAVQGSAADASLHWLDDEAMEKKDFARPCG
jgi:hypothetical protein